MNTTNLMNWASSGLSIALLLSGVSASIQAQQVPVTPSVTPTSPALVPLIRNWTPGQGRLRLPENGRIVIKPAEYKGLAGDANEIAFQLQALTRRKWLVVKADRPRQGDIALSAFNTTATSAEAYRLSIDSSISIAGGSNAGVFYGAQTLLQMIKGDPARSSVPRGLGTDFPEFGMRSVMLDLGRHYFELPQITGLMAEMARLKLNTLHLHFTDWPAFRLRSAKFPGLAPEKSYGREDVALLESVAKKYHITIVPEIDLPAHAVALTAYNPKLAFECPSMRQASWLPENSGLTNAAWTIDITQPENNAYVKSLLDEFIPWFQGPYFHLGGDEYQYDEAKNKCLELLAAAKAKGLKYPGDVMVDWINQTNEVIKSHGKKTIIWNWWGYKDDRTSIEPAKDIIIEVWTPGFEATIIDSGYETILSSSSQLYVVPGGSGNHPDTFGGFDTKNVYEKYPFAHRPKVKGFSLSIWTDDSIEHTDRYILNSAYEPMLVMAERLWSGRPNGSVWDLFARANLLDGR